MLSSERRSLVIEDDKKLFVVGERINPTGKKDLQASLREKNMDLIITMAEEQEEFGADVLDVNVGMNGIDEVEILFQAVTELSQAMNLPLSIDTSNVEAMEKALRNYPGRALMNSISLDPEKMQRLIPMAKKYGAMFVLLPLSEEGVPKNLEEKKSIIRTIVDEAKKYGITENEIVVDGLVTTVGANKKAAIETLETIRYCKYELGLATVCGLSNISFGLPERSFVNSTFLALAIKEGLTMAIANPMQELLMNVSYATDLLLDRTHADERYVERVTEFNPSHYQLKEFGTKEATRNKPFEEEHVEQETPDSELYEAVLKGRRELTISYTKRALERGMSAEDIIQEVLIKAIDQVGKLFEIGRYFLPQLMNSAEAMKAAVEYLEPLMTQESNVSSLGVVVVATVKGDIHDIGKNLVGIMLKNCGFEVHDLGKNIDAEEIIDAAKRFKADLIGLSALMTTTMMEMKNVVDLAKDRNPISYFGKMETD